MTDRRVHPWLFLVLVLPFGVMSGYAAVTLAYQLKMAGVTVAAIAALVALSILPQTWKFLWAPIVDITLNQKKWYVISCILSAVGIGVTGFFPATKAVLAALSTVVFVGSVATTFLAMSIESMIAHCTPDELRGRVSGWYQAGNLGGYGIGGGLALFLAQHFNSPQLASTITGALCLLCCLALLGVPTPTRLPHQGSVWRDVWVTVKDVWQVMRRRTGILAFILCFLPIGSGAAPFASIAPEWSASADTVALVSGVMGGVISALGCLCGGWICDRMHRQWAYVWFGLCQAAAGISMALFPRSHEMFIFWTLIYTFTSGLAYAAFSAFVLEAIGKGAAATKYNALASLSNVPIWYMTSLDGWTHDRWNSTRMFFIEAGLAISAAIVFSILVKFLWPAREPSSANVQPAGAPLAD